MRFTLCAILALLASVSSWGQDSELHLPGWFQVDPAAPSPTPALPWTVLDSMLEELERRATASAERSERLALELRQAQADSEAQSRKLSQLETKAADLSSSLARAETSLRASSEHLRQAALEARRRSLALGLWRAGTLAGVLGFGGALADAGQPRGAAIGAGLGGIGGLAWLLIDRFWP